MEKVFKGGAKCECNWGAGIGAGIVAVVGIYFLFWGINQQWTAGIAWNWWALLYYLIAVVLLGVSKMWCYKACGSCEVHGK